MMIKWGGRKMQQPPSSPRPSLLSSWLLRLKKMGGGHYKDVIPAGKQDNPTPPPPVKAAFCRSRSTNHHNSPSTGQHEEFYGGDQDFWRLSFRKEKDYETEEEKEERDDHKREAFTEMVSGIRRMKQLQTTSETLKETEFKSTTPRRKKLIKCSSPSSRRRIRRKKDDFVFSAGGDFGDERRKPVYVKRRNKKKQGISCRVRVVSSNKERKGGLERFAVVKCSLDPERDFRESMVEMILEKNICGPQQLEDLLACYLALNSHHYHHLIIKVFRQIWFHFNF